jgi:hypothetical protein
MTTIEEGDCVLGEGALACGAAGLAGDGSLTRSEPRTINGGTVLRVGRGLETDLVEGISMGFGAGAGADWAVTESRD